MQQKFLFYNIQDSIKQILQFESFGGTAHDENKYLGSNKKSKERKCWGTSKQKHELMGNCKKRTVFIQITKNQEAL
jgi:hypothetical protein